MKKNQIVELKKAYELKENELNKKSSLLSTIRFIVFAIFLAILIYGLIVNLTLVVFLSLVVLAIFLFFVIYHELVSREKIIASLAIETLNDYLARFNNDWIKFKDNGLHYFEEENFTLSDLDIIGEVSLFKYINVAKTKGGKKLVLNRLSNINLSEKQLKSSQESTKEISENLEFSVNMQANLKHFSNENINKDIKGNINSISYEENQNRYNIFLIINILLSVLSIVFLFVALANQDFIAMFITLVLSNLGFSFYVLFSNALKFSTISSSSKAVARLENLYKPILEESFKTKELVNLQNNIKLGNSSISKGKKINSLDSFRTNILSYLFLNMLFPLNTLIIKKYNKFAKDNKDSILKSIESFEYFELYLSLAIIPQVKEIVRLPSLSSNLEISFEDMKHPLLSDDKAVANSYETFNEVTIITGSNMSGKTSFLRTIGINLILMQAGGYVCATKFKASYLKIFTSMRIKDDISKGISSFYAELLRIKEALDYQKTNKNMLVLVDEIFRGTNFNDRIDGAINMIKKLNHSNVILFITTHDLKLCEVDIKNKKNYHFSEEYENGNIKFDYKLKTGKCLTTNAKYLMNLIGIN